MGTTKRYRIDRFHATSLENNPLNSPVERDVHVYLPPGYFESENRRYPVIYFLHGYGQNNQIMIGTPRLEDNQLVPVTQLPPSIQDQIDATRILSYVQLDELITSGEVPPFIFVQPDGSLHLPQKHGGKTSMGVIRTKGSGFVNSPFTGNYVDYIVHDILAHIDTTYRTFPEKSHRALMGVSMGGYGTLNICLQHPQQFGAAAALSPANITLKFLDLKLVIPLDEQLLG
jgi:S-formylglutathione hydrolase